MLFHGAARGNFNFRGGIAEGRHEDDICQGLLEPGPGELVCAILSVLGSMRDAEGAFNFPPVIMSSSASPRAPAHGLLSSLTPPPLPFLATLNRPCANHSR
jgi:hypothetical protein